MYLIKKGQKRPYYGKRTKREVIESYFKSSASMDELSEIHSILGSNTVASWLKKYENFAISKFSKPEIMPKQHSPIEEKNQRKKDFKLDVVNESAGVEAYILEKVRLIREEMPRLGGKKL